MVSFVGFNQIISDFHIFDPRCGLLAVNVLVECLTVQYITYIIHFEDILGPKQHYGQ